MRLQGGVVSAASCGGSPTFVGPAYLPSWHLSLAWTDLELTGRAHADPKAPL